VTALGWTASPQLYSQPIEHDGGERVDIVGLAADGDDLVPQQPAGQMQTAPASSSKR
jgi:hypothetical protein